MDLPEFTISLAGTEPPPGADTALKAAWWAAKGEWERAHEFAQSCEGEPGCDLVHAHLHRWEGDLANARYWYRRAGVPPAETSIEEEREALIAYLLNRHLSSGDTR